MNPVLRGILRAGFALASALCLWIAAPMLLQLISACRQARDSEGWPKVSGRMLTGDVNHPVHRPQDYTLHFRYEFTVGGKRFEGTQINAGDVMDTGRFAALQERYAAGREVSVA